MAKITIVGAGLAGMVAAINLAREGYEVEVLEASKEIGGIKNIHPSTHCTPINQKFIHDYVGIDLSRYFIPVRIGRYYIKSSRYSMDGIKLYIIERGARKTSIDTFLYNQAKEAGVKFHFSSFITNPDDLPPNSIIATGHNHEMFDYLEIPYLETHGYGYKKEIGNSDHDKTAFCWFGTYSVDYGYAAWANGLEYFLLFSRKGLKTKDLKRFERHLKETEGIEGGPWGFYRGAVPMASVRNPRLFWKDKILSGCITGTQDPAILFGIHGAILSGKVASIAVSDRERAMAEFKRLNRYYVRTLLMYRFAISMPFRLFNMRMMIRFPLLYRPIFPLMGRGIPGYDGNWMKEYFFQKKIGHGLTRIKAD